MALTFEKIAALYLAKITIEGRAQATLKKVSSFIAIANKDFGRLPINDISSAIVLKTLKKSEAKELYETAHRIRSTVGAVFRYAIANGLAENDPTFALREALIRQKTKSRAAITKKMHLADCCEQSQVIMGKTPHVWDWSCCQSSQRAPENYA